MNFLNEVVPIVVPAIGQTLILVFVSSAFAVLLGLPVGVVLTLTRSGGLKENPKVYSLLDSLTNFVRSVPFIILMLILIPVMRLVTGKAYGTAATIIPLTAAALPFFARLLENALNNVDRGIIEAARAMGTPVGTMVRRVLIPEALPQIINAVTLVIINLVGYSAMAGAIGGGGLGEVAVRYGYSYKRYEILWVAVILIVILVQLVQWLGTRLEKNVDKK
ncbi:ABC transporter permease [Peptoniphilus equinus]|uniref:ABC transporter permease n=1 Tax=Peptoniphilus equinus TaxID=3016343 RepID=A0ABY7QVC5_9FIRM|nr:methionine ABC transporter permease [Peptoniphilus equinus]WBW50138.1 ABC transporter permease [Peptoniphilus equinus]